ncbi:hypothetical protein D3C76_1512760 [compost metagenome]
MKLTNTVNEKVITLNLPYQVCCSLYVTNNNNPNQTKTHTIKIGFIGSISFKMNPSMSVELLLVNSLPFSLSSFFNSTLINASNETR